MSNQYSEIYSRLSTSEILDILDNKKDFDAAAIEAANIELEARNLSEDELASARLILEAKKLQANRTKQLVNKLRPKAETVISSSTISDPSVLDELHVKRTMPSTILWQIKFICIVLSAFLLISTIYGLSHLKAELNYAMQSASDALLIFLPAVIPVVAIILFWLRRKVGWILLSGYLMFSLVFEIVVFLIVIIRLRDISFFNSPSGSAYLAYRIFTFIIYGVPLFFIMRKSFLEVYSITSKTLLIELIVVAVIIAGYAILVTRQFMN